jgi:hypothetical protein
MARDLKDLKRTSEDSYRAQLLMLGAGDLKEEPGDPLVPVMLYMPLSKPYKGWDNETYPQFSVRPCGMLDESLLTSDDGRCDAFGHKNRELFRGRYGSLDRPYTMVSTICLVCATKDHRTIDEPKTAPVQGGPRIPWAIHLEAWDAYRKKWDYGGQSAERLAQRGGFHADEMDEFVPDWRTRIVKR